MKKIIFDLMVSQPVGSSKYHGGGEYTKTIFKELVDHYSESVEIIAFYNPDLFIDEWVLKLIEDNKICTLKVKNYRDVSNSQEFKSAHVFVACLMTGLDKVEIPKGMKVIGVFHGFRALEKPIDEKAVLYERDFWGKTKVILKKWGCRLYFQHKYNELKKKVECCTDIIGVSNYSGYSARIFFPDYSAEHIHIFYPPQKFIELIENTENNENDKDEPYILMLGGDRWIKNLYRGAKAIDELFSECFLKDYKVKVVGNT